MDDYYRLLGITREATPEIIRRAYHQAARRLHPDVNHSSEANEAFLRLQTAYEVLCDPQKRREYDASLPEEAGPPFLLKTIYSRSALVPLTEPQILYTLLELSVPPGLKPPSPPSLNICLVLDRSTSMQGRRLDQLKKTAIEIIRQALPKDSFSIIAFSDRAEILYSPSQRSSQSEVETKIQMLQPRGATEIFHGLMAGYSEVRRNRTAGSINHILLITDGCTYGDEEACINLATRSTQEGIGISSLGIGHEWNDIFLEKLANITGGSCAYLPEIEDLPAFLLQKLQSLSSLYAERVVLDGILAPGVELGYACRLSPEPAELETELPIQIGGIAWDSPLTLLLELTIPPIPPEKAESHFNKTGNPYILLEGMFTCQTLLNDDFSPALPVILERQICAEVEEETPPPVLMQALSRLNIYRMQERAREELAAGEIEKATRRLQRLATHLFSKGERELARNVLSEAAHVEKNYSFSQEGEKRLKYGTRALLPLPESVSGHAVVQQNGASLHDKSALRGGEH